jgi:hypothetical protein
MTPPPSTPKKTRRVQPKIIGHTSPTPRVSGTTARTSLRNLGGTLTAATTRPTIRPPVGAPGMHGFPRARISARDTHSGLAVSVARALHEQAALAAAVAAEQAAAEAAAKETVTAAPEAVLIDANKSRARRTRATDPKAPARPSVRGRPTTPDEAPLSHAPAAERLADRLAEPNLRTTAIARPQVEGNPAQPATLATASATALAPHRPARRLTDVWVRDPSRPRPSRLLAELNAALADEAAAAE